MVLNMTSENQRVGNVQASVTLELRLNTQADNSNNVKDRILAIIVCTWLRRQKKKKIPCAKQIR